MKYWQNDTWGSIITEDGETLELNLWTCDNSGRQYLTFYPELTTDVVKSNEAIAHYEVIKKEL
jgi:hypothetical protein